MSDVEPALHVWPGAGWLNDPNGPIRWNGRWHVFFQHNPARPEHGDIHWGHVSSTDLLSWRHEPLALRPRPGSPDAGGCWSGCVTSDHGVPAAVYTAITDRSDPGTICVAYGDDALATWRQPSKPVATVPEGAVRMRDPFVFHFDGEQWAVVGATLDDGRAAALLFSCNDLQDWEARGTLATSHDPEAARLPSSDIWECPQLVRVNGRWVLILSLWHEGELTGVGYLVGDVIREERGLRFAAAAHGLVDAGRDFYAPAVLADATSERGLMWGWCWEARDDEDVAQSGWAGVLTLPRTLRLAGDLLLSEPAAEVDTLRADTVLDATFPEPDSTLELPSSTVDVEITLAPDFEGVVALLDPVGATLLELHTHDAHGQGSLHWTGAVAAIAQAYGSTRPDEPVTVRFVVDRTVVEAFCSHHTTATARSAAATDGTWRLRVRRDVPGTPPHVRAWGLATPPRD